MSDARKTRVKKGGKKPSVEENSYRIKPKTVNDGLPDNEPKTFPELNQEVRESAARPAFFFNRLRGQRLMFSMRNGVRIIGTVGVQEWGFLPLNDVQIIDKDGKSVSAKSMMINVARIDFFSSAEGEGQKT